MCAARDKVTIKSEINASFLISKRGLLETGRWSDLGLIRVLFWFSRVFSAGWGCFFVGFGGEMLRIFVPLHHIFFE